MTHTPGTQRKVPPYVKSGRNQPWKDSTLTTRLMLHNVDPSGILTLGHMLMPCNAGYLSSIDTLFLGLWSREWMVR
ncbi:hypothetical protein BJX70DRAFT_371226 [Aspergillus crustosus]